MACRPDSPRLWRKTRNRNPNREVKDGVHPTQRSSAVLVLGSPMQWDAMGSPAGEAAGSRPVQAAVECSYDDSRRNRQIPRCHTQRLARLLQLGRMACLGQVLFETDCCQEPHA